VGVTVEAKVGTTVGVAVVTDVGRVLDTSLGPTGVRDGKDVEISEGNPDGFLKGSRDGEFGGLWLGSAEGSDVTRELGTKDGLLDSKIEGLGGFIDGSRIGSVEGSIEGQWLGARLGISDGAGESEDDTDGSQSPSMTRMTESKLVITPSSTSILTALWYSTKNSSTDCARFATGSDAQKH
jgi:hypothetical protein